MNSHSLSAHIEFIVFFSWCIASNIFEFSFWVYLILSIYKYSGEYLIITLKTTKRFVTFSKQFWDLLIVMELHIPKFGNIQFMLSVIQCTC